MITIYTDASCIIPLGISGWAAIIFHQDGRIEELSGSEKCGRINRMELLAVIKALSTLSLQAEVIVYTDSQYVMRGSEQFKTPDENADLWRKLDRLKEIYKVHLKWVRSHSGDIGNEYANKRARDAARKGIERRCV
jgi:ribonuclease HI